MMGIRTILHPTDFSECSNAAFALARSVAGDRNCRLIVLHVASIPMVQQKRGSLWELQEILDRYRAQAVEIDVEPRLEVGDAAGGILRIAEEWSCDLVVMGTRGRGGVGRMLLGSVARDVMRHAPCPVAAATISRSETSTHAIRAILHPTDFSRHSEDALRLAYSLARGYGARLTVLHVVEPRGIGSLGMAPPPPLPSSHLGAVRDRLQRWLPQSADDAVRAVSRVEEGDPAGVILGVAQRDGCDLIVMGTQGRTGLERLCMGSVAERTVREAGCPVLTVKAISAADRLSSAPQRGQLVGV